MFRATLCPSSGALSNCSRSSQFPSKCRGRCVSSRGLCVTDKKTTAQRVSGNILLIIRSPSKLQSQPPFSVYVYRMVYRGQWQTDHGWKHIHLGIYTETGGCDCSLRGLLMMGRMLPETCWAASMRLSNKFYNWVFICLVVLSEYLRTQGTKNHKFTERFGILKNSFVCW
jgi:hypothetical protein